MEGLSLGKRECRQMQEPQGIIPTDRKEGKCRIFESVSGRRIWDVSSVGI